MKEVLAIRDAIIFYKKRRGLLKSSSKGTAPLLLINWCKFDSSAHPWGVVSILADIKSLAFLLDVLFCLVMRSANSITDFVARKANNLGRSLGLGFCAPFMAKF